MKKIFTFLLALTAGILTVNASDGALSGKFTINVYGNQVVFSQGNLQYVRLVQSAPSGATAIDQVSQEPIANSQKLIKDGQLLILRDGKVYTVTGQEVK